MTPVSHSRGILYSAPPKKTARNDDDVSVEHESTEPSGELDAASVSDETERVSDANWTGTVPADD